ncbi:Nuclear receptor-binding factor 2 [Operophtera brumata]|uniref:Nuclear receptor-binding factor 2 n=1 Tax=Operophtera brumata TaxID=104452 RepID=A0A0L7L8A3_OPEBR|nr:Nuclear receptor-binding factor 2 [Operophtera brumata]
MESHPLNLAHQQHRRAEAHLMHNRYDEAMQCHHTAAELLLDAMKSTGSSVALESITLQHNYHLKQKDLIKSKQDQYARVKKAMDSLKCLGKEPGLNLQGNDYAKLQVAIYRAINETDSLLHTLLNKQDMEPGLLVAAASKGVDGKRTEKTKEVVVEELQILSQNLHSLVEQLVMQVEVLKDDNSTLKERVLYLEKERLKYLNLPSSQNELPNRNFDDFSEQESEPKVSQSRPTNAAASERPAQHTHFDLSAFRDN